MQSVTFEDIRCFAGRHEVPLAPLNLLVGENSTGKTTFLALARLASRLASAQRVSDFNEPPFELGSWPEIARRTPGSRKIAAFSVAGRFSIGHRALTIESRFVERDSQPQRQTIQLALEPGLRLHLGPELAGTLSVGGDRHEFESPFHVGFGLPFLLAGISREVGRIAPEALRTWFEVEEWLLRERSEVALAPMRSRPKRTYDPRQSVFSPEGDHVPQVLAANGDEDVRPALDAYGRASGLFESIRVDRKGSEPSDPFQVRVTIDGLGVNLVDVGYGVSQVLPLLVETARAAPGTLFLVQQPEVHLHPRAQAALGSYLGTASRRHQLVVETHSDYLVDRVRMDVRAGTGPKPEDVAILYFERGTAGVNIHRMGIDAQGNLTDVPDGYRSFFLAEERRLLGL